MPYADSPRPHTPARGGALPPRPPLPGALQTLACFARPLTYLQLCRKRYGDAFTLAPLDMPPLVFLSNPRDVRAVLTGAPTALHPGAGGSAISPIVGEQSFMLQDEDAHVAGRRAVLPAFHRRTVEAHAHELAGMVEREVATWPLETPLALHPRLRSLTLRVILRLVFGHECPVLEKLHRRLLRMLSVNASLVFLEPKVRAVPPWRATWGRFQQWRAEADALMFDVIRRRRAETGGRTDRVLDLLLSGREGGRPGADDREVRDDLMSVILAGHETTAAELAWAFQLIAHHPAVQRRLHAEIDGDRGEEYLLATIHEVLRHRPVFLFAIPRAVVHPVEVAGVRYDPPTRLLACIFLVHHDPRLYPEPQVFRPERFLHTKPAPWAWIPWGGGRKRCPGNWLALLEMRTVLRAVLAARAVLPASARVERAQWRSVIVTPHAGGRVVLRSRRAPSRLRARESTQIPA